MKHDLPTADRFAMIVADIISQRKSHSKATAMAVEFLAYTGLRISEAQSVRWRDIKGDHLVVRTAKNDDLRQVPLIPAALALLARMKAAELPTGDRRSRHAHQVAQARAGGRVQASGNRSHARA